MRQYKSFKLALAVSLLFSAVATHALAEDAKPGEKVSTLPEVFTAKKTPSVKVDPQLIQPAPPTSMPPLPNVAALTPAEQKNQAFEALLNSELPMTPEQIIKIRRILDDQQKAKATLPYVPPKPMVSTMIVTGEPGEVPPVLRLAKNFVSTVVFSDVTGAPWPITSYGAGNDDMFAVSADDKSQPNVLTISTGSAYAYGNLKIALAGRPTPIMMTLVADQKYIDYQANVAVQSRGPNAVAPIATAGTTFQTNPTMIAFLDGAPPEKATPLEVADPRVQGWKFNDKYYVRTKMTLYSPAWSNHHASPDGMHAYEITPTPVIVSGENGNPQSIRIGE